MKHFIRLTDYTKEELLKIFDIADSLQKGNYQNDLYNKTVVMFFPESSIRTRVTFEKGIYLLGGQTILFPPETLEKKEDIKDVIGYLNNWADAIVVRHRNIDLLEKIAQYSKAPLINAMTDVNHPCEVLSDLYSFSKIRSSYLNVAFLFRRMELAAGGLRHAGRLCGDGMDGTQEEKIQVPDGLTGEVQFRQGLFQGHLPVAGIGVQHFESLDSEDTSA